jgi:Flp pilus assembly protein TadB
MSKEQERLKRLRERQLTDRDPLVKQRDFQRTTAQKERKASKKRYTLGEAWRTIPNIYRSTFIGLILGLGVMFVLPMLWKSEWAFWVAVGVAVFAIFIGLLAGRAQDIRDELRDSIKH